MPSVNRKHKGLNNRAENSHQPTRRRERQMKRFKSAGQAQRSSPPTTRSTTSFISAATTSPPIQHRADRTQALQAWAEVTGVAALA